MKILKASKERTKEDRSALRKTVGDIIENVIENGEAALLEYNHRFDGCDRASLRISKEEIEAAYKEVPEEDIEDIKKAAANIKAFAQAQRKTMMELKDFSPAKGTSTRPVTDTGLDGPALKTDLPSSSSIERTLP